MNLELANLVVATREQPIGKLQMLVGRKKRGLFAGRITFPGGKLAYSTGFENRYTGAQREFTEETGIQINSNDLRLAGRIRLYGDRFGLIDIFTTHLLETTEPQPSPEIECTWRTVDDHFYDDMPTDTELWLPKVFTEPDFRMNALWKMGALCMIADGAGDSAADILRYFKVAEQLESTSITI